MCTWYKYNITLYNLITKKYKGFVTCVYCYYRNDRPSIIYWAGGLIRGRLFVQGRVNVVMEVGIGE